MIEPTQQAPTPARVGPRPLPLHLMSHAATMMGSRAALPLLRNGSLPWRPELAEPARQIQSLLAAAGPEGLAAFDAALAEEGIRRHQDFLAGIERYRRHPYRRAQPAPPVAWAEGTTRLLDYRPPVEGEPGLPVLVVPSLINRAYIVDLGPRRSLMRGLAARGLAPFLVDWDAPGELERGFTLTDYVAGRLEAALETVAALTGGGVAVIGYCMGGMLALALAQRRPDLVRAVALLATPWDFLAGSAGQAEMVRAMTEPLARAIAAAGAVPVDLLQAMFSTVDPSLCARKFIAFSRLNPRSARARDFVALEDWANDGVPLAGPVARECLLGWYGAGEPARGEWRIAGRRVLPAEVAQPTLLIVPKRDRIVPPDSALPLSRLIPDARVMLVGGGHVGMLTGARVKTDVEGPLAKWLVRSAVQ